MPSKVVIAGLVLEPPFGKFLGDITAPHIPCPLAATQGAGSAEQPLGALRQLLLSRRHIENKPHWYKHGN